MYRAVQLVGLTLAITLSATLLPKAACATDGIRGKVLYQTCAACHNAVLGEGMGPDLRDVLGRKAGSLATFKYSRAMSRSEIVWNEEALRAFVRSPQAKVPGTSMTFPGYESSADVEAVIEYLKSLR